MKPYLATLAALTVLALSGCGDKGPSAQADPTSPSLTATASSSPTGPAEPTMPSAAYDQTKAGAIAFAKYYWALVDYSMQTLQTSQLSRLQGANCRLCKGGTRWIDRIAQAGGTIEGAANKVHIRGVDSVGTKPKYWFVMFRVVSEAGSVRNAGKLNKHYNRGASRGTFTLLYRSNGWVVTDWKSA